MPLTAMKRGRRESSFCNNCKRRKAWYLSGGGKIPQGRRKGAHWGPERRPSQAGQSQNTRRWRRRAGGWRLVSASGIEYASTHFPHRLPETGTQVHTGTFQGNLGQDLRKFTEPGLPVGHLERGPVKFVAAILPFAAVEVQDVRLVTGEQPHVQVFPGVSKSL